jgi:hypothetical protein
MLLKALEPAMEVVPATEVVPAISEEVPLSYKRPADGPGAY